MTPQIVPTHRKESIRDDRMLFVRTESILETMVRTTLAVFGLIIVALTVPIQPSFGSPRTLDLILYQDGSAHVSMEVTVDPLEPDHRVEFFGPSVDNFVAVGENEFLLSHGGVVGNSVVVDTLGSSLIHVDYDIHDLISKEGRVWTFMLDSPTDYSLLMPANSVIVGMSILPSNMVIDGDQTRLELDSGLSEINYILGTPDAEPVIDNPPTDFTAVLLGVPIVAAASVIIVAIKKRKAGGMQPAPESGPAVISAKPPADVEEIIALVPDMREDDKDIVRFISKNGGEALESDLRKRFLQPRTTMWRAVKRLERQGIIETTKKDSLNLVRLKKPEDME